MNTQLNGREMPRYKSHKTVWALEIASVTGFALTFAERGYTPITVEPEMFTRYTPIPGDFLVQYRDGYKSISPRGVFLNGYSHEAFEPDVPRIARVCHEVNRAYCAGLGDNSQPAWADAPEWQQVSAANAVMFALANPHAPPSAAHDNWLAEKALAGWTYGPVKDPETKRHPCFVPYDELPAEQRIKDYLFQAVVRTNVSRQDDWARVSAAAGVDPDGGILPPVGLVGINRASNPYWKNTTMEDKKHDGLPVAGYKPQSTGNVERVNANKRAEESLLRTMDEMRNTADVDQRWLAVARTHFEEGFMAMNRSIFRPGRVALPGDGRVVADSKPDKVVRLSPERWELLVGYVAKRYGDRHPENQITVYEPTEVDGILFSPALYRAA